MYLLEFLCSVYVGRNLVEPCAYLLFVNSGTGILSLFWVVSYPGLHTSLIYFFCFFMDKSADLSSSFWLSDTLNLLLSYALNYRFCSRFKPVFFYCCVIAVLSAFLPSFNHCFAEVLLLFCPLICPVFGSIRDCFIIKCCCRFLSIFFIISFAFLLHFYWSFRWCFHD